MLSTARSAPLILGYGAGAAILLSAFQYTGGRLSGFGRDPDVDEVERKEFLRKNRRRPLEETINELGEGRGEFFFSFFFFLFPLCCLFLPASPSLLTSEGSLCADYNLIVQKQVSTPLATPSGEQSASRRPMESMCPSTRSCRRCRIKVSVFLLSSRHLDFLICTPVNFQSGRIARDQCTYISISLLKKKLGEKKGKMALFSPCHVCFLATLPTDDSCEGNTLQYALVRSDQRRDGRLWSMLFYRVARLSELFFLLVLLVTCYLAPPVHLQWKAIVFRSPCLPAHLPTRSLAFPPNPTARGCIHLAQNRQVVCMHADSTSVSNSPHRHSSERGPNRRSARNHAAASSSSVVV